MGRDEAGAWQRAQSLMNDALRSLGAAFPRHAAWNALMVVPSFVWLLFVLGTAIGIREADGDRTLPEWALPLADTVGVLGVSLLSTLHRAVAIEIGDADTATLGAALRRTARRGIPLVGLALVLGSFDLVAGALAWALASRWPGATVLASLEITIAWLATRPMWGLATVSLLRDGGGPIDALRAGGRLLRGHRVECLVARSLLLVVAAGAGALFVGVPLMGVVGMDARGIYSSTLAFLLPLYTLALPWAAMHLGSLDARLEATLYDLVRERVDAASLARTFE